ncbi:E3 ubiquitin-protein ligase LRSAM1 [Electrophorus electricus]|uniref:RING-type domain-containing protein n=1 Tax=Electrophorus electricus TaxID=8005 RepID=A0A4W4G645_ELEEL|nr:E3 ubiquitin-protein ligase LRSAM1 [Electrophorus electricus]XP_026854324.2 E3 ubiquitin-protein ligase LRSAM1 [Electrophorus electricus]XP_026854325.2 E3 ubiquitin-protein ligase LRSAM1 [Electrophorus electricus]
MPLFTKKKKPSENSKKRLEYQLCLSKEAGADDILDISSCELSEVPSSAFSICKVLQKKVFILCGNELRSLVPKGCTITALTTIKVLDLHENKLTSLPDDIGQLTSLQVLNAENNQIKALPETVGDLRNLQTLNVKGNCLSELPLSVGCMSSLRTLDLSENSIRKLPKELASVRTLESLTLDASVMNYPPASVCTAGTEEVQRYLCSELGLEYCPPSQYLLPVLENDDGAQSMDCLDGEHVAWQSKFMDYEKRKEQKQLEKLNFEKVLEEKQREQAQLLLLNNSRKEGMLLSVKLEQERVEKGVCEQQRVQEAERQKLLQRVQKAEASIAARISNLLLDNKRQAKSAEILQALEEDRIRMEHLTAITQEESSSLRKRDVAVAMQTMLSESYSIRLLQEASDTRRQNMVSEACKSKETLDKKFEQVLTLQQLDKSKAISQILQEEEMQKAAFEALQLQKDSVHGYIRNQIKLIEAELLQLTKLEVKRRSLDAENLQEALAEQRTALTDMLQQLLKQKDQREMELKEILLELELKSDSTQQNYWMIQYQRLLDAKPLSLRMQEAGVDKELVSLLSKLSAQHYLPLIAHHRITAESLCHMTTKDLSKLGINEVGVQKSLLRWAREQTGSPKMLEAQEAGPSFPSAPQLTPPLTPNTPLTPTAPSPMNGSSTSECVVCMELESQVVFLPCGHVCCCQVCSEALHSCPLCRADISQRVRLYHG